MLTTLMVAVCCVTTQGLKHQSENFAQNFVHDGTNSDKMHDQPESDTLTSQKSGKQTDFIKSIYSTQRTNFSLQSITSLSTDKIFYQLNAVDIGKAKMRFPRNLEEMSSTDTSEKSLLEESSLDDFSASEIINNMSTESDVLYSDPVPVLSVADKISEAMHLLAVEELGIDHLQVSFII